MEEEIQGLKQAIEACQKITNGIQNSISQDDFNQFNQLIQLYSELRSKLLLIKKVEDKSILEEINSDDANDIQQQIAQIKDQISQIQVISGNLDPDQIHTLVGEGKKVLNEIQTKIDLCSQVNLDDMVRLAQDEVKQIEEENKMNEWFEAAYKKLSDFAQIELIGDNCFRIMKEYTLNIDGQNFVLNPNVVFIQDISSQYTPPGICLSEIIERIAAYRDMQEIAAKIGWKTKVAVDAPLISLIPPSNKPQAIFALIGYKEHPLVECGNIDVEAFNNSHESFITKIQKLG